ncbi:MULTISPECIES: DUF2917 domain-containing protein [unclassified Roseateles]|uniref:DUF2917 domain-containing protein n=1 Tax=unclassified Roseateles TaxID=2626991 RepID=UPI00138EE85B|nr:MULTISPECIES: DUF2917 domain-containing protein [unclassified Roseateles]
MRKPLSPTVVDVDFAKSYCVTASRDVWVVCLTGTAWLTRDGCLADLILSPGDVTRVLRADAALVTGMPRCRLGISEKREHLADLQGMTTAVMSAAVCPAEPAGEIK